jgi:hypothetical protein
MAVHRRRRRHAWVLTAVIGCTALAACSSTAKPAAGPTLTASTTSTTTVAQLDATIISSWQAAGQASLAAAKDPTDSALITLLVDYFTGPELSFLDTQYTTNAADGLKTVGTVNRGNPRVVSLTATQAVIVSCETDGLALVHAATGQPLPGPTGNTTPTPAGVKATMTLTPSGVWKESALEEHRNEKSR